MIWLVACVEGDLGAFVNEDGSIGRSRSDLFDVDEEVRSVTEVVGALDAWLTDEPESLRLGLETPLDGRQLEVVDAGERVGVVLEDGGLRLLFYLDRADLQKKVVSSGVRGVADARESLEEGVGVSIKVATPVDGQLGDYHVVSLACRTRTGIGI